jgi:multimeric flavodoxin WrbA
MKITAFNGSPKGPKGNTQVMVNEFLGGAQEAGAETECIFLAEKDIKPCKGCFGCWIRTPGECPADDDMPELLDKILKSDIIVYASPVYVGSVTGLMKNFLDRTIPMADPHFDKMDTGLCIHKSRYEGEANIVLISNCGFPEMEHFKYFRTVFEYMVMNSNCRILAEIYRSQGEMLTIDNPMVQFLLGSYKKSLRKAGQEIVEQSALTEETKQALERPLVPVEQYIEMANQHFDSILANLQK